MKAVELAEWSVACGREPVVRIGVVLPEDNAGRVRLEVPAAGYRAVSSAESEPPHRLVATTVVGTCTAGGIELSAGGTSLGGAQAWRIDSPDPDRDIRTPCVVVHGVVVGRGFHWEKRLDESLPGSFEIRQVNGRILLVNLVPLDLYLKGVITAEMSGQCPLVLLKAQCVTARSWNLARTERKHADLEIDFCNDDCCQRYQGLTFLTPSAGQAVDECRGEIMLDNDGAVIDANYSKSCGGICEASEPVWGFHKSGQQAVVDAPADSVACQFLPVTEQTLDEYLTGAWLRSCDAYCSPNAVPDADLPKYLGAVDDGGGHFRWTVEHTRDHLEALLRTKFFDRVGIGGRDSLRVLDNLVVTRRGLSGRAVDLDVVYRDKDDRRRTATIHDQYWIRHALAEKFLFSSAIRIDVDRDDAGLARKFRLTGAGWGHGAGLCQIGALGMALHGHDYRAILHHYYSGVRIERVYG